MRGVAIIGALFGLGILACGGPHGYGGQVSSGGSGTTGSGTIDFTACPSGSTCQGFVCDCNGSPVQVPAICHSDGSCVGQSEFCDAACGSGSTGTSQTGSTG